MSGLGKQIEIAFIFASFMKKLLPRSKLTFMDIHHEHTV
jgi:hypothetical protein